MILLRCCTSPTSTRQKQPYPRRDRPTERCFEGHVPTRGTLLGLDNPDHDRLRLSVSSFFVPRRLKTSFALPLPLKMITTIVGLAPERFIWVGESLAFFGGHPDLAHGTRDEQAQKLLELHAYISDVIEERRTVRRDDLISHVWNVRDSGEVEMTDFEMLSMFPGLILAGHETTTNLLSTGLSHLLHTGQYEAAQTNDESRAQAIEELLRYESAIMGMRRRVTAPTLLAGTALHPGDEVFLAYASGSRDEKHFSHPDELDIDRPIRDQHLGFGLGIHACLGAPLARLLLGIELSVIKERLPNLRLAVPYEQLEYLPVSEGRGLKELPVAWDVVPALMISEVAERVAPPSAVQTEAKLLVESKSKVAEGVAMLTLRVEDGESLPAWFPGAHIDVAVDEKTYRQYSLCGNPANRETWQISVLREPESRGGSIFLHGSVQAGDWLRVRGPRNHFSFQPSRRYIFIAGGIGITPIKPMVAAAAEAGSDWKLIYLGRARSSMAFVNEMRAYGDRVTVWPRNEHHKPFDLSFLSQENPDGLLIYCCGPERLLSAVETACASHPIDILRVERFAPQPLYELASVNLEIEVVLEKSGITLTVPPNRSILEVVNEAGAGVVSTCQEGTCGTCEVRVLEGEPEHRDSVLTASERAANEFMMICVSRCRGKRLVLDL
jgi:cytochrome P450/ferredoxin-NADP reductase